MSQRFHFASRGVVYSTARGLDSLAAALISYSALQYIERRVNKACGKQKDIMNGMGTNCYTEFCEISVHLSFGFNKLSLKEQKQEVYLTCMTHSHTVPTQVDIRRYMYLRNLLPAPT